MAAGEGGVKSPGLNQGETARGHARKIGKSRAWGCQNRIVNGRSECDSHHVNEEVIEKTYLAALNDLLENAGEIVETIKNGAGMAMEPENRAALEQTDDEIIQLQEEALELHRSKHRMEVSTMDYESKITELKARMKALEARRAELQSTAVKYAEVRVWLDTFIEQTMQSGMVTAVDGTTLKMLVERILIRDKGMEVQFKCGVTIEKEYVK